MKNIKSILFVLISVMLFSGCEAMEIIESQPAVPTAADVLKITYDSLGNPKYLGNVNGLNARDECLRKIEIYPGDDSPTIVQYTYNGAGILSDSYGNVYYYDKDGLIHDRDGNPTSDKVVFIPEESGCSSTPESFARTFSDSSSNSGGGSSDSVMGLMNDTSDQAASGVQVMPIVQDEPAQISLDADTVVLDCRGNISWKDFYPNAPNYRARAAIEPMQIQLTFDFENGSVDGEFCGHGENPNNGHSQGSADFCVSVKDSHLYPDFGGSWAFDGVWDIDLEMSGAQLHWEDLDQVWAYNTQHSRYNAEFHGWIEPGDGSLYTDEVLPATLQFLCDFVPPDSFFE